MKPSPLKLIIKNNIIIQFSYNKYIDFGLLYNVNNLKYNFKRNEVI